MPMRLAASCCVRPRLRIAFLISITKPVLILSFSASGRPRSAYTLPEPCCTSIPSMSRFFISQLLCKRLGRFEPGVNNVHIFLWRGNAALAFLLEAVEDEHCLCKLHGVHGTVGAANIVFHHLKNPGTTEAFEYLGCVVPITSLRQ